MYSLGYWGVDVELESVQLDPLPVPVELDVERRSLPVRFRFKVSSVVFCASAAFKLLVASTTTNITAMIPR